MLIVPVIMLEGASVFRAFGRSRESYVRDVVRNTLTAPFVALAYTLAYYRLRALAETAAGSGVSPEPGASTFDA